MAISVRKGISGLWDKPTAGRPRGVACNGGKHRVEAGSFRQKVTQHIPVRELHRGVLIHGHVGQRITPLAGGRDKGAYRHWTLKRPYAPLVGSAGRTYCSAQCRRHGRSRWPLFARSYQPVAIRRDPVGGSSSAGQLSLKIAVHCGRGMATASASSWSHVAAGTCNGGRPPNTKGKG